MAPGDVTASVARNLLDRHDLRARKGLGQHFLVDPNTVHRIVRLARVEPGETILEIGPGLGSLTVALAGAGARVIAVEVDKRIAAALREVVGELANVRIVEADALRADLESIVGPRARLVANLPYNIATPILARVLDDLPSVTGGLVMAQKELGERWTSPPGSRVYGSISVKVAYYATARVAGTVPPTVFMPAPKVSSVLVAFDRRSPPVEVDDARSFLSFVESTFGHRRKTIRNSLVGAGIDRETAASSLAAASIDPMTRPEQLDIAAFAALYRAVP